MPTSTPPISEEEAIAPIIYKLGKAIYIAQQFESTLLIVIALLRSENGLVTKETFANGVDEHSGKTLGQLAGSLKASITLPINFEEFIKTGVKIRNDISHGFVFRNTDNFLTKYGRANILNELKDAQFDLNQRRAILDQILSGMINVLGGSMEDFRKSAYSCFTKDILDEITRH